MKVQINVKTPKGQAAKSMKTQKLALLGMVTERKIIEEKVVSDNEFYWRLEIKPKELLSVSKKCAMGELMIKKFYGSLFKLLSRANKLAGKFKKGASWIKKFLIKRIKKTTKDPNNPFVKQVENMTEEQIKDFIKVNDREAMDKLLSGNLITIKKIK